MTGSGLAPVVIPIVVSIGLAVWLTMVFRAASHPQWKHQRSRHLTAVAPEAGTEPRTAGPAHGREAEVRHAA